MKFKILILGALIVALAASAYIVTASRNDQTYQSLQPSSRNLYNGILGRLKSYDESIGQRLSLLIPGEGTGDQEWNFRGAIHESNGTKPFYGTIRSTCHDFSSLDCWSLALLTIDGTPVFAESKTPNATAPDTKLRPQIRTDADKGETSETAQPMNMPGHLVADSPPAVATWRTTTDSANARLGPGTQFDVAFQVPSTIPLTLVEKQGDWGLFSYRASDGTRGRIWIAMSLVLNDRRD
jgi:uncharacterized protein YgiM (DUF1202 family)